MFLPISVFVFAAFMILLGFRNEWLLSKRLNFIDKSFKTITCKTLNVQSSLCSCDLVKMCLWNYHKSLLCFWIWNFEKMVKDKDLYNEYYIGK